MITFYDRLRPFQGKVRKGVAPGRESGGLFVLRGPNPFIKSEKVIKLSRICHHMVESRSPLMSGVFFRWGPSLDGIVVESFQSEVGKYLQHINKYDILAGISTADATLFFSGMQLEYGINTQVNMGCRLASLI